MEVLSPRNSEGELREKMALYFDAGAKEAWICSPSGTVSFRSSEAGQRLERSQLCPKFPARIKLR